MRSNAGMANRQGDIDLQLSSWGWAHSCSKHVEDSNKYIIEEIVRQVGHLPELHFGKQSWPAYRTAINTEWLYQMLC